MSRKKRPARRPPSNGPRTALRVTAIGGAVPLGLAAAALTILGCAGTTEPAAPDEAAPACPRTGWIQPTDAPILGGYPGPGPSTAAGSIPPGMLADACAQARRMPPDDMMRKLIEPQCPPLDAGATPSSSSPVSTPSSASPSAAPRVSPPPATSAS